MDPRLVSRSQTQPAGWRPINPRLPGVREVWTAAMPVKSGAPTARMRFPLNVGMPSFQTWERHRGELAMSINGDEGGNITGIDINDDVNDIWPLDCTEATIALRMAGTDEPIAFRYPVLAFSASGVFIKMKWDVQVPPNRTVEWSFGSNQTEGDSRVVVTGGPNSQDGAWHNWVFIAGVGRGREVWLDGELIGANVDCTSSMPNVSATMSVGSMNGISTSLMGQYSLGVFAAAAWSPQQIKQWSRDPWGTTFIPPRRYFIPPNLPKALYLPPRIPVSQPRDGRSLLRSRSSLAKSLTQYFDFGLTAGGANRRGDNLLESVSTQQPWQLSVAPYSYLQGSDAVTKFGRAGKFAFAGSVYRRPGTNPFYQDFGSLVIVCERPASGASWIMGGEFVYDYTEWRQSWYVSITGTGVSFGASNPELETNWVASVSTADMQGPLVIVATIDNRGSTVGRLYVNGRRDSAAAFTYYSATHFALGTTLSPSLTLQSLVTLDRPLQEAECMALCRNPMALFANLPRRYALGTQRTLWRPIAETGAPGSWVSYPGGELYVAIHETTRSDADGIISPVVNAGGSQVLFPSEEIYSGVYRSQVTVKAPDGMAQFRVVYADASNNVVGYSAWVTPTTEFVLYDLPAQVTGVATQIGVAARMAP